MRAARTRPRTIGLIAGIVIALAALGFGADRWNGGPTAGKASAGELAFGFGPADGWNTLSTGLDPPLPRAPEAIAANVPIPPWDGEDIDSFPDSLDLANQLSGDGVVITVWLYGRDARDSGFPPQLLPLQLSDATLSDGFEGVSSDIANETLLAGVGNWDVELHAWFGTNSPTQAQLAAAQEELDRLVIPTS